MKPFTVAAIMTRVSSLRDKGVSIGFHTKELSALERSEIMEHDGLQGWVMFSPNVITEDQIPTTDAEIQPRTQSQRIRACIYRLWQSRGSQGEFEAFYAKVTENIINSIKEKIL